MMIVVQGVEFEMILDVQRRQPVVHMTMHRDGFQQVVITDPVDCAALAEFFRAMSVILTADRPR